MTENCTPTENDPNYDYWSDVDWSNDDVMTEKLNAMNTAALNDLDERNIDLTEVIDKEYWEGDVVYMVVRVTPDSVIMGGILKTREAAEAWVEEMVFHGEKDGVTIIERPVWDSLATGN